MHDLSLQVFSRRSENLLLQKDYFGALKCLEKLRAEYEAIPATQVDALMREKLAKTRPTAQNCAHLLDDPTAKEHALVLADWLDRAAAGPTVFVVDQYPAEGASCHGIVDSLPLDKQFGFVLADDGRRLFFHRNSLTYPTQWKLLRKGLAMVFAIGSNSSGVCAIDVAIEQPPSSSAKSRGD